jgi:hypothetical protein
MAELVAYCCAGIGVSLSRSTNATLIRFDVWSRVHVGREMLHLRHKRVQIANTSQRSCRNCSCETSGVGKLVLYCTTTGAILITGPDQMIYTTTLSTCLFLDDQLIWMAATSKHLSIISFLYNIMWTDIASLTREGVFYAHNNHL